MVIRSLVKPRAYRDSVKLMNISATAKALPGVDQAAAIMGTDRNKTVLQAAGLLTEEAGSARPDDLVIVVRAAEAGEADRALARIEALLAAEASPSGEGLGVQHRPRTLEGALRLDPAANLALISVPGQYAAALAGQALRRGLHVHVFSDNVTIEEEVALKRLGAELGLLVMGPDCGTAIIGGAPLGFANGVARGPIGVVGASGTGLQQVTSLIDRLGSGISHAIGTGGRDLSDAVGGVTLLAGIDALEANPETKVIVVISKPPGARTAERVLARLAGCRKPVVVDFLGGDPSLPARHGVRGARTLEEAAVLAVALAQGQSGETGLAAFPRDEVEQLAAAEAARLAPKQRYLRGLFTGGSLADEAMGLLRARLGGIHSNTPLEPGLRLADSRRSVEHTVVDLGDDEFTNGRPHPMIDPSTRDERLAAELTDPEVAVVLCDVVLGYGVHPDPGGDLTAAVRRARALTGRHVAVVASVCGTDADPQNLARQEAVLRAEDVLVLPSNAYAAEVAGAIVARAERGI
jgi:FdrA protein